MSINYESKFLIDPKNLKNSFDLFLIKLSIDFHN